MVNILLSNPEIDVNIKYEIKFSYSSSYETRTALCVAIENTNIEIIKSLLKSNEIDLNGEQRIYVSYPYDEYCDPVTRKSSSALSVAIESGNIDVIKLLLSCPDIDLNYQTDESVDYLSGMSSFYEYKMGGGWEYIMPLIYDVLDGSDCGYTISTKKTPMFCEAVASGNIEIINLFLALDKIDVNDMITKESYNVEKDEDDHRNTDKWQWSPCANTEIPALCIAVKNNDVETVKILLSNPKINVNVQYLDESYEFVFYEEEEEEECDDDEERVKKGEWKLNKKIKYPLHIAVKKGNEEIIKLLLKSKNIDSNKVDDKNKKAFDYADNDEIKKLFQ